MREHIQLKLVKDKVPLVKEHIQLKLIKDKVPLLKKHIQLNLSRTKCLMLQVDLLEIALWEQHDLVEKIFLVEATANHRGVHLMIMMSLSSPLPSLHWRDITIITIAITIITTVFIIAIANHRE